MGRIILANKEKIPLKLEPWPSTGLRRASVNSFGYGGTNAHVILDDAHHYLSTRGLKNQTIAPSLLNLAGGAETGTKDRDEDQRGLQDNRIRRLFIISSQSLISMEKSLLNLKTYLLERSEIGSGPFLEDLAYTLSSRRSLFTWRIAYNAATVPELIQAMNDRSLKAQKVSRTLRLGFVFTGQGAQWHAMGRELVNSYPTFRETLLLANDHFCELGAQWNIISNVYLPL